MVLVARRRGLDDEEDEAVISEGEEDAATEKSKAIGMGCGRAGGIGGGLFCGGGVVSASGGLARAVGVGGLTCPTTAVCSLK